MQLRKKEEGKVRKIRGMMVGGKKVEKKLEDFKRMENKRKKRRNRNKEKGEKGRERGR